MMTNKQKVSIQKDYSGLKFGKIKNVYRYIQHLRKLGRLPYNVT